MESKTKKCTKHLKIRRIFVQPLLTISILLLLNSAALAHCEIPCGIYDDEMRIKMISEHITTIEKSMKQIMDLQGEQGANANQLVRWIMNKEDHANEIQHIVSQYFMTQRIKPDSKDYSKKLALLHMMLVHAMKCKQATDLSNTEALRSLVHEFSELYFGKAHN